MEVSEGHDAVPVRSAVEEREEAVLAPGHERNHLEAAGAHFGSPVSLVDGWLVLGRVVTPVWWMTALLI